jgi:hypothetical protein
MGQKFLEMSEAHLAFIQEQQMFFVATADTDGRVNISPKGLDAFRVINNRQIAWLNLTGSGNETAAHIQNNSRMTIMFNAFVGAPLILRLYGSAQVVHHNDSNWQEYFSLFENFIGARQIFIMEIDLVQSSCGMAVPLYDFKQQREALLTSGQRKGIEGIKTYWRERNHSSIDGKPTHIVEKNL